MPCPMLEFKHGFSEPEVTLHPLDHTSCEIYLKWAKHGLFICFVKIHRFNTVRWIAGVRTEQKKIKKSLVARDRAYQTGEGEITQFRAD